jgi:hypothetical protein
MALNHDVRSVGYRARLLSEILRKLQQKLTAASLNANTTNCEPIAMARSQAMVNYINDYLCYLLDHNAKLAHQLS